MGLFWDLIQQGQISDQQDRAQSLEQRMGQLEQRVEQQQQLILKLLQRLDPVGRLAWLLLRCWGRGPGRVDESGHSRAFLPFGGPNRLLGRLDDC